MKHNNKNLLELIEQKMEEITWLGDAFRNLYETNVIMNII